MKVPMHVIKNSTLRAVASDELKREVEEEIASAEAEDSSKNRNMDELLEAAQKKAVSKEKTEADMVEKKAKAKKSVQKPKEEGK